MDHFFLSLYWICYNIASVFYVLFFWPRVMWDLSSPTRDRNCTPCIGRQSQGSPPSVFGKWLPWVALWEFVCILLFICWHECRREAESWFQSLQFTRWQNLLQVQQDPSENGAICTAETFFKNVFLLLLLLFNLNSDWHVPLILHP